ncbi:predicted protein [Naegleria gruberi]|uniref:Predicted protein n=1 Tax=Naegleria gruberi TaxID=5762 RepID=D2VGV7_NAEGR|nr:uncharacterized protein NAEGRDRAFT_49429 [Naegleria gruberi]EFC44130.1 predicted protein [Naegleria gruberi]|eukprot:XP_002676874.1 predicted protein [Naegleria gruberi strain NEG-M]
MASWIFQNYLGGSGSEEAPILQQQQGSSDESSPTIQSQSIINSSRVDNNSTTIVGQQQQQNFEQTSRRTPKQIELNVSDLFHRIETSSLLDDKIDALESLIELSSRDYESNGNHREFKTILPKLFNIINQNENESSTMEYLTIVSNLTQLGHYGQIYLDALTQKPTYVTIILSLLNENNSHIRFHSIQILTSLLKFNPQVVQDCILREAAIPLIISVFNSYGALRNEGIIFLKKLVESISVEESLNTSELKKILVFEGIFDILFGIILQEGGNQGGIIVLDCLVIIHYLLQNNELNRKQFLMLQNGGMTYLHPLLLIPEAIKKHLAVKKHSDSENGKVGFLQAFAGVAMTLVSGGGSETLSSHLNEDENSMNHQPTKLSSHNEQEEEKDFKKIANSEKQLEIMSQVLDILLELMKSTKEPVKEIICNVSSGKGGTKFVNNSNSNILIPILRLSFDYTFSSILTSESDFSIPELIRTIMYDINMKSIFLLGHLLFNNRPAQEIMESYTFQYPNNVINVPQQGKTLMFNGVSKAVSSGSSGNGVVHALLSEESAIIRLCKIILYSENEYRRQLSYSTLRRFLHNNKEGQLLIASTVKAPTFISSSLEENMLCGIILSDALFSLEKPKYHILECVHAVSILSSIIRQSTKCKEILLEIPYDAQTGAQPKPFFTCLVNAIVYAIKARIQDYYTIALLRLLCEWINGSSSSAKKFMEHSYSTLLFFIEVINSSQGLNSSPIVQSLCCMLLGLVCVEYEDPSKLISNYSSEEDNLTLSPVGKFSNPEFSNIENNQENTLLKELEKNNKKLQEEEKQKIIIEKNQEIEKREILLKDCKEKLRIADEEIQKLRVEKENAQSEINETNESFQNQVQNLSTENQRLKTRITDLSSRLETIEEEKSKLLETSQQLERDLTHSQQKIKEYKSNIEGLESQLRTLHENLEHETKEKQFKNNIQQEQLTNIQMQLKQKDEDIENILKDIDHKEVIIKNMDNDINNMRNQTMVKDNQISTLFTENENLKQYIAQLTLNLQQAQQQQITAQEALAKQQKTTSDQEKRIQELEQDNEDMIDIIEKLEEKLNQAQKH